MNYKESKYLNYKESKSGKYTIKEFDDGSKFWSYQGECHREDGPALEYADGNKSWYIHDILVYNDYTNNLKNYKGKLSEEFKKSIIKYKLSQGT